MEEIPFQEEEVAGRVWGDLGVGLVLAVLCLSVGPLDAILQSILILFHELGHAANAWLFGYPGLPAFDLRYGGGVTTYQARSLLLVALVYLLLASAGWLLRENDRGRILAASVLVGYALCAHTDLHQILFLLAGHGGELLLGGIFLYRGMSGASVVHEQERPLYICIGSYVVMRGMLLAWGLMTDPRAKARYQNAKGGGHWMDFSRLAEQHLNLPLETVAGGFLLACLATPLVVWAVFRHRVWLSEWFREALEIKS